MKVIAMMGTRVYMSVFKIGLPWGVFNIGPRKVNTNFGSFITFLQYIRNE
jgi:hypothetical protein